MFSTFAMIPIFLPGVSPTTSRMTSMSDPFLTKEAAMKSTLFFTPQFKMSSLSFSVIVGKFTFTLGKFMFFRSPSMARLNDLFKFSKKHKIKLASIEDIISYRLKYEKLIIKKDTKSFNLKNFNKLIFHNYKNKLDNNNNY